ncbi:ArnT family glycosyltransferase [Celeribacter marinus]|uniref:Polymyxin resistance protein ArnT, undecaprenyl phosphate-alpha-L-Ara4N transferase n=1 Tax=Celeribacter marinus TaxID=1397108 RepID=A0A0N9ZI24_9RHOB|nr:glycosyltransferase family 39 protein [Celeribacter marinus]ALI56303.1 Polymyxin resistance protein ArnT, undecaprenyl phosphate-alpha-L-Ara4N transferase [Celeribacter marinus]SFK82795.1 4-amino-4-deoxy-L-arabinose transferase [Celeribacter marinus]
MGHPNRYAALAVFAVVTLFGIALRPLLPIDETRYVGVAWDMHLTGDYLVPTKNFELYTHKPPLLFWVMNLLWGVFGVSEYVARLAAPMFSLATIWLTGRLATQLWPDDAGIGGRAMWALAGTFSFAIYGGATMFDTALATATLLGLLSLVAALKTGRWRYWTGFGVALAVGALAKGPVIFVHLLPAVLFAPVWAKHLGPVTPTRLGAGLGLALITGLAVAALWLVPAIISGGAQYRDAILWKQSAGRIAQSFAHARPFYWYAALTPLLLFPWVFVPQLWRAMAKASWADTGLRLAAIWGGASLILFSFISGKQLHYLVPELPAIALIVARLSPSFGDARPWIPAALIALAGALFCAAGVGVVDVTHLSELLTPQITLLAVGFTLLALSGLAMSDNIVRGGAVLSLGLLLCLGLTIRFTDLFDAYDARIIAQTLAPYEEGGIAVFTDEYHAQFNFGARATRHMTPIATMDALKDWAHAHPNGAIVGRRDKTPITDAPATTIVYDSHPYAIWPVDELTREMSQK